jgi:hypothetical protein
VCVCVCAGVWVGAAGLCYNSVRVGTSASVKSLAAEQMTL